MTFHPAPNIVQVECIYNNDGETAENVYHVDMGATPTAANMDALIQTFVTWENTSGKGQRSAQVALITVRARDLSVDNGMVREFTVAPPISGTIASNVLPNNVTLAVKASTGLGGRSYRGRTFWIGIPLSMQNNQAVSTTYGTALVSALNSLITAVNAVGTQKLVVLSRYHNKVARDPAIGTPIVNFALKDYVFDSQRRRLPFHNRHH